MYQAFEYVGCAKYDPIEFGHFLQQIVCSINFANQSLACHSVPLGLDATHENDECENTKHVSYGH